MSISGKRTSSQVIVSDITAAGSFDLTAPPSATDPVTQATYTPAFNSLAFPAVEDLGALCQLRSDTSTLTLTLARVKGVEVDATGVTFVVASQSNTRSFQVFGVTGALRAPLGSIAALVPDSMSPVLYRIEANATPFSAILLRETEISGRVRDAGEFAISDRRSERAVRALRQRLEAVGAVARESAGGLVTMIASRSAGPFARSFEDAARRAAVSDQRLERRRRRGGSALKVLVDGGGPVVVRREDLVAAGMPSSVPTRRVRVFKDGQPLALRLVAPGTRDEGLRFEASRLESRYTAKDAYVVSWTGFAPRRRSVALTLEGPALAAGFTRVEKSAIYLASAPEGADPWLWSRPIRSSKPGSRSSPA